MCLRPHGRLVASAALAASLARVTAEPPFVEEGQLVEFKDTLFHSTADSGYFNRCLKHWQEECLRYYDHDVELRERLCHTRLDRNYVKIRLMVPPEDIMDHWARDKDWRDFNVGFYKAYAPQHTREGFNRATMPVELHKVFQEWYKMNRHMSVPEDGETAFGLHCNTGHDSDDFIVPFSPTLPEHVEAYEKAKKYLMGLLSEWTGQDVNENTVTYGVRQYHRGSICGMHVDNPETHAFGIVYNVDQRNLDEPWPFHYVSHTGVEHRAFLEPGDLVMYESATSLHGRKEPLRGDEYAALYFHFRSPNWVSDLDKWRSGAHGYFEEQRKYQELYKQKVGRSLFRTGNDPTVRRHFNASTPCLPLRGRAMPLMVDGHFMDIPPAEDYNYEDFKVMMESVGEKSNGHFADVELFEYKASTLVDPIPEASVSNPGQMAFSLLGVAGFGVTCLGLLRTRRDCTKKNAHLA